MFNLKNLKYIVLILVLIILSVFFRLRIINFISARFSRSDMTPLTLSEREEFNLLKQKNKVLEIDNKNLQNNLGILDDGKASAVALILTHSNIYSDFYTTLPKDKTLYKGMNVYAEGNIVVGQATEILTNSMRVENLAVGTGVIVEDLDTGEFLEIHALGNGLYTASIPGGSKVAVGSQIVMKGYPKAIIGAVTEINKSENSLSNILIQAPYNILNKDIYYVIQ